MNYKINVSGQGFISGSTFRSKMVTNSQGVYSFTYCFDSSWEGITKFACFKNSSDNKEYHILLDDSDLTCIAPWECLQNPGVLFIGVLGIMGEDIVKPTLWCSFSDVVSGVNPDGEISKDFTPSAFEQVMEQVNNLQKIGEQLEEDAASGKFDGEDGQTPNIKIGVVETLPTGSNATASVTGNTPDLVLNLGIPRGEKGTSIPVTVGTTTTGNPGTDALVSNSGDENQVILNFTIPAGPIGPSGPVGSTPSISVKVTGLPSGSEPTVKVSGTQEYPVIHLGIPSGPKGDSGDKGNPGQTPNITIGQVETLPAGSAVTASITGETPNLVLNLGIPQGQQGEPGQTATIEIAETETVSSDAPAAMVELPDSTPQARRYKAQVPQGIQGPAGTGLPALSGPEDAGKVPVVNPEGTGWLLGAGGGGVSWEYHEKVTLLEDVVEVRINPDRPLKAFLLLIRAKQKYDDGYTQEQPSGRTSQNIRLNGIYENMFYTLFEPGSYSSFVKSRAVISIIQGNLVGTYEYLPGSASGGYQITGIDSKDSVNFPTRENINEIMVCSNYKAITGVGNVGRFAVGSTFEIWGVYA